MEENNILTALYTEEEVKKYVFQICSDGFPAELYLNFWEVIKANLVKLYSFLHPGQLELFHLNFG
jgi:hypothetical protein